MEPSSLEINVSEKPGRSPLAEGFVDFWAWGSTTADFSFVAYSFFKGPGQYNFNLKTGARAPEPVSLTLVGVALLSCAAARRRRA